MRRRFISLSILALGLVTSVTDVSLKAAPAQIAFVANASDSGPGSFRAAIDRANANSAVTTIQFIGRVSTIALQQTVWFNGPQNLTINGTGAILDGTNADGPAFRTTGGGDLTVVNLTVRNAPAEGIAVEVPSSATGTVRVKLRDVAIIDNAGHGVLVNDQDDPATPEIEGESAASVDVSVVGTRFIRNGYSVSDRDGLRVNEGGEGDLKITVLLSQSEDNAADGIEVDERGDGDVRLEMFGTRIRRNGKFDPTDLDDGFDIDEAGDGSVLGSVMLSEANDNYEEGFDFNENDGGDLRVDMLLVEASRNGEEGIDYEEDDDFAGGGDLVTTMDLVKTNGNRGGDAGLKIREKGEGSLERHAQGRRGLEQPGRRHQRSRGRGRHVDGCDITGDGARQYRPRHRLRRKSWKRRRRDGNPDRDSFAVDVVGQRRRRRACRFADPRRRNVALDKGDARGNTGGATTGGNVIVTIVP